MSKREREFSKALNKVVVGTDFQEENTNKYLYASLSQPPIKVIDTKNSDDEFEWIVECPNCKNHVCYGTY